MVIGELTEHRRLTTCQLRARRCVSFYYKASIIYLPILFWELLLGIIVEVAPKPYSNSLNYGPYITVFLWQQKL